MKLKRWALIAEIVGGLAIVLSLIFVGVEVRQNTEESRAANQHMVIAALREQLLVRAQSPALGASIEAASAGGQITPEQESQYRGYFFAVIKSVEEAFSVYMSGGLEKEYLDTRIAGLMIPDFLGNEFGRGLYEGYKTSGQITAEFAQAVDARLADR